MTTSNNTDGFGTIDDLINTMDDDKKQKDGFYDARSDESAPMASKVAATFHEKMEDIALANQKKETQDHATLLGMPFIELEGFPIGPEVLTIIPEEQAREFQILPFFHYENEIRLATVNPDQKGVTEIIAQLQREFDSAHIAVYLTTQHSFDSALKLYKNVAKVKKVEYGLKITADQLKKYQTEISSYAMLERHLLKANMTESFAMIISMALNADSSDVHIEAEEGNAIIRFRIDGVLIEVAQFPLLILGKLVNRIKSIAHLKINVSDVPQDGSISIHLGDSDELDIRVSTLPSAFGESIVFRLLRSNSIGLSFADLGMRDSVYERLKREIEKPNGMIITTGPTGSGKTTTLYAILNTLNTQDTKIITLENPIEYKLKGIVQSQIDHSRGYTFAKGLRAILRQDPDIVMVGEIRDYETAQTAIDAALTGHLMLSTIHTNDAAGVVPRFLGMGVKGIFLAPSLNAVIGQRLVRRICEHCKTTYTPPAEEIQKAKSWIERIPKQSGETQPNIDTVTWYKGIGCARCHNTGYKGRVGIYEVFTLSPAIEQQILSDKVSEFQMKDILRAEGMVTMGQDGVLKAIEGMTTLDEVYRVAKE